MSWIYLSYGRPGEGKSLDQAKTALELFNEYHAIERRYPDLPRRKMYSNQKFSPEIEAEELFDAEKNPGGHLVYWENPRELRDVRDCDILWDEIANHLPADSFKDTPRWLRALFAQHRKRGIRIFANTQDYKAVDINVRRMVGEAYKLRKLFGSRDISVTLPPVTRIWGLIVKRQFDPAHIEVEQNVDRIETVGWPTVFWISKRLTSAYDTSQDIPPYAPDKVEHRVLTCIEQHTHGVECDYKRIDHSRII